MSEDNREYTDNNCVENDNHSSADKTYAPSLENGVSAKKEKKISLSAFLISATALVLVSVMLTFSICNSIYKSKLAEAQLSDVGYGSFEKFDKLDFLDRLFEAYSYYDLDDDAIIEQVLKAYVRATGDKHAVYYTSEEYLNLMAQNAESMVGIGISVLDVYVQVGDKNVNALGIVDVTRDSPAHKAGVKIGDAIISVGTGDGALSVEDIGYDKALSMLLGVEGSMAEFRVLRRTDSAEELIDFSIKREKIISRTVYYTTSEADASIGILTITGFDARTPPQFKEAVDALIEAGCTKLVFDLRDNPGGDAEAIVSVLSYFANTGDVIMSTKDKSGNEQVIRALERTDLDGEYESCIVYAKEIGQYRNKFTDMAVLCNGNTASAGELFTAFMRDYELATIVGEKTYGKGSVQSLIRLGNFGYTGAIRLTTLHYFPPCNEGYDGIGIYPDEKYSVSLSEEAKKYALYELPQELDDQLRAAINSFN